VGEMELYSMGLMAVNLSQKLKDLASLTFLLPEMFDANPAT
jgi:hypothetical protein